MADNISTLQVRVQSNGVRTTTNDLKGLTAQAGKAETATAGLLGTALRLGAAYVSVSSGVAGFNKLIQTNRQFQVMNASLKTAVGTVQEASIVMKELQRIAAETPFSLSEVTTAFTKLVNYGLTPSERALVSYGNTSAALGKNINDMIEAVADAATGEFERLKEFGIKSKNEGDKIVFTFRGAQESVANNARAIEEYLIKLGEKNYGSQMAAQMQTLDGAFANLEDSWDQFLIKLGESSGVVDLTEETIRGLTSVLEELAIQIESGEIEERIAAWMMLFQGLQEVSTDAFSAIMEGMDSWGSFMEESLKDLSGDIKENAEDPWQDVEFKIMRDVPLAVSTMAKLVRGTLDALSVDIAKHGDAWYNAFTRTIEDAAFNQYMEMSDKPGTFLNDKFGAPNVPTPTYGPTGAFKSGKELGDMYMEGETLRRQMEDDARTLYVDGAYDTTGAIKTEWDRIMDEAIAQTSEYDQRMSKADQLRKDFEAKQASRPKVDLGKYGVGGDGVTAPGAGGGKGKASKESDFEKLQRQLQAEEQAIGASLDKRLAMIEANTAAGSALRAQTSLSAISEYEEDMQREIERDKSKLETMWQGFENEENLIRESYERRRKIILEATSLTEEQRMELLGAAQKQYETRMKQHRMAESQIYLDAASNFFGDIAQLSNIENKKMFKIAQGAAIAQATIKMYESATSAYAAMAGIPYIGPALGVAAAGAALVAGAANIASIKGQTMGGSYATGGIVPGASYIGDNVQANVNSGEMILNSRQQRNLWDAANGGGQGGGGVNVNVYNNAPGVQITRRESGGSGPMDPKTLAFIIEQVDNGIARGVQTGRGKTAQAMENTYPISRGKK